MENPSEKYTASTLAAKVVRAFPGISLTNSIDFIRWQIILEGNRYSMNWISLLKVNEDILAVHR